MKEDSCFALACIAVMLMLAFALGGLAGSEAMRRIATEEGHAEYYLDKNNNQQWRWLEPCAGRDDR